MDRVKRTLLQIERPLAWWMWKTNIFPFARRYFKKEYDSISLELKEMKK